MSGIVLADRPRTLELLEVSAPPVRLLWIHRELEVVEAFDDHDWSSAYARRILDVGVELEACKKIENC